jgi:alcohol dehydrogenase
MNPEAHFNLELRKFAIPEVIFGVDSRFLVGNYARKLGAKKVLLVTGPHIQKLGWADDVINSLNEAGITAILFSQILPNPRDFQVMAGAKVYLENSCDSIITIGGGSVIDCAKGIGIVATNHQGILEFEGVDKVIAPMPPIICLPTTAGTSADISQFAIINNSQAKVKIAIISKAVIPDLAILDPVPLQSMSAYLTACTGIDALCHAFEAYVSNASSHITDLNSLEAIKLVVQNLKPSIENPYDIETRTKVMMGSFYAGMAFSNASLGCVHALAHSLGGYLDLPHGECNALLLPYVVAYNFDTAPYKYTEIAKIMGLPASAGIDEARSHLPKILLELNQKVGITKTLGERGVDKALAATIAEKAFLDPCNVTNPRVPTIKDLENIIIEAL